MILLDQFMSQDVIALVTDRTADFSLKDHGAKELPPAQKEVLSRYIGGFLENLVYIKQVHGLNVIEITKKFLGQYSLMEADGLITREANVPLTIRTADCLPIFLFDPVQRAIGLVHAGWKGTLQRIVSRTILQMQEKWGTAPADLKVALGPAIRSCCYEVGEEFKKYFPDEIFCKEDRLHFDLPLANRRQLLQASVRENRIFDCGLCTCCNPRFFSYRKEGESAGRMLSLMMIKG